MEQEFLEVTTPYTRTETGLILPHQTGRAVLALGLVVPEADLNACAKQLDITLEPNQGAIYLSPSFFTLSALKVAREHGWTPPTS